MSWRQTLRPLGNSRVQTGLMLGDGVLLDLGELSRVWEARWPGCRPISYELRRCAADRWVRFHSLPGSQRYAWSEEEYEVLLSRDHTILTELNARYRVEGDALVVATYAWSSSPTPPPNERKVAEESAMGRHWMSLQVYPDEDDNWMHVFVWLSAWRNGELGWLLRRVADNEENALMMPVDRDELRSRHADWLSLLPSGL
jgi:hypothetical protein